jgi:hypothetical protein
VARLIVDGRDVAPLVVASSWATRLRGLLSTTPEGPPYPRGALLLSPANSVHGWGMRYTLDVAQLDAALVAVRVHTLRRGGLVVPRRGIHHVLEAESGAFSAWLLHPGSQVAIG